MKDLQPALRAFLLADPELSAAVGGGRIYSITFPQGMTEPSVLMTRISGLGEFHLQGPSGLNRNRVQLGNWARSVSDACELARLVKTRLNGHAGPMGTGETAVKVLSALYDSEREIYDDVTGLYGVTHDYLIMFDELGEAPILPASWGEVIKAESPDALSGLGRLAISGAYARTEAADALTSLARLAVAGAQAGIEGADTLSSTAGLTISGSLAKTEGADVVSATAGVADSLPYFPIMF